MKTCSKCKIDKNETEFRKHPLAKDGLHTICRSCAAAHRRKKYQENPEIFKAATTKWIAQNRERHNEYKRNRYRKNPRAHKNAVLKRCYGITLEEKEALMTAQGGQCGVCRRDLTGKICVDHDHKTGKIRGILCSTCNSGLGFFGDSIEIIQKAISYLEQPGD